MNSKICVVIPGPTLEAARQQITQASLSADLLEFRLDLFQFSELHLLKELQSASHLPVIFTLRKASHGGAYNGNETSRLQQMRTVATLQPNFLDLECDVDAAFFAEITQKFPKIRLICSMHDLNRTPQDLAALYNKMRQRPASGYKLVTMAHSVLDSLHMLAFAKQHTKQGPPLVALCMGNAGQITRVLSPVIGNAFTYAALNAQAATAPGQIDIDTLLHTYRYRSLNAHTQLFGLIGDPIEYSRSHQTHNAVFEQLGINAIYLKMRVLPNEMQDFLQHAHTFGFQGLSVTMPLKEITTQYVNEGSFLGALNTLAHTSDGYTGYNTDVSATVELIKQKMPLKNKTVVLLGAGGVAKALAHALAQEGSKLIILNRTLDKAQSLAKQYHAPSGTLEDFPTIARQGYDLLINTTSVGLGTGIPAPIETKYLLPSRVIMDVISSPSETLLIKEARKQHCAIITGKEMFVLQAAKQFALWLGEETEQQAKSIIRERLEN